MKIKCSCSVKCRLIANVKLTSRGLCYWVLIIFIPWKSKNPQSHLAFRSKFQNRQNLFVVQLRRLRWFKHNESCAKPNPTGICPVERHESLRAKPGSLATWPPPAVRLTPSACAASARAPFFSLLSRRPAQCYNVTSNTPHNAVNPG